MTLVVVLLSLLGRGMTLVVVLLFLHGMGMNLVVVLLSLLRRGMASMVVLLRGMLHKKLLPPIYIQGISEKCTIAFKFGFPAIF